MDKGRLFTNHEDFTILVQQHTSAQNVISARTNGRVARLLNDEPIRTYVLIMMRPPVMQTCHTDFVYNLGTAKTLSLLERFYWWIGMGA